MEITGFVALVTSFILVCCSSRVLASLTSGRVQEYCENESFHAKCGEGEVIMMTSADYGRMQIGKCITELFEHMPCKVNALHNMDRWCSGRRECKVVVTALVHDGLSPCPKDYRSYLQASYKCVPVLRGKPDGCFQSQTVLSSSNNIASMVASETNCGSIDAPWIIQVPEGQKINFTLYDFSLLNFKSSSSEMANNPKSDVCMVYAVIKEESKATNPASTICAGRARESHVYTSIHSKVEVRLVVKRNQEEDNFYFLLRYEAIGCENPEPPDYGWVQRTDNGEAVVRCNASSAVWRLRCENGAWHGETGFCPKVAGVGDDRALVSKSQMPGGVSIAIIAGVAICVGMGILFVGVICLRRRRKRREVPRYGTAQPYSSTQSYSTARTHLGSSPNCKHFPGDTEFYGVNDNRYYPTWNNHGINRQGGVTTGNAMPPSSLTDAGISDPDRKSIQPSYYSEHIYESPQFERRDYSFVPRETNMDQTKYFELDPKIMPATNNNGGKSTTAANPKEIQNIPSKSSFANRYST